MTPPQGWGISQVACLTYCMCIACVPIKSACSNSESWQPGIHPSITKLFQASYHVIYPTLGTKETF